MKPNIIWICNHCKEEYPYEPMFCNGCGIEFIPNVTFTFNESTMQYTVFENKETKGRFFSSYTKEDTAGWYNIIGHCNTVEDAQAMCNVSKDINEQLFLNDLPEDLRDIAKKLL